MFSDVHLGKLIDRSRILPYPEIVLSELGNLILLPVNFVSNHLLSFNLDATVGRWNYECAIRKTFHDDKNPSFAEIARLIDKNDLPYFIINTSAAIDFGPPYHGSKLANRVFEFTPLRFGSDGFGYSDDFSVDVGRAVAISGAAVDLASQIPGRIESTLASALNMDLGYHIKNFNKKTKLTYLKQFIPFYFLFNTYDRKGTHIYLTDGGHTENLGVYSLVRRLCRKIIVVDATYDPDYHFEDYFKLKNALRSEMQVELEIKEIDSLQEQVESASKNSILNVDSHSESNRSPDRPNAFDRSSPILHGIIRYFPIKMPDNTIDQREIEIVYIKLSINDDKFHGFPTDDSMFAGYADARSYYGENLVEYYLESKINNNCGKVLFACEFPQYTTLDQDYTPEQFKAYIDLGYRIVRNEINQIVPDTIMVARTHR